MDPREGWSPSCSSPPNAPSSPENLSSPDEDLVLSEVHLGCPPGYRGPRISRFTFSVPHEVALMGTKCLDEMRNEETLMHQVVSLDEDGDLVVTRRSKRCEEIYAVTIQHNILTSIPSVGLQVWRAELVLADFVLHKMVTSSELRGVTAIELGAGTGLVGILLACHATTIFLTDHGDEVLDNCAHNVRLNCKMFQSHTSVRVCELDWKDLWPPKVIERSPLIKRYAWSTAELEELHKATLILAADVIYGDDLTDAFFNTLERLVAQGPEKVIYLALEKRYNFTFDDLNVVANGYSHFRSYLKVEGDCNFNGRSLPCFVGRCIDLTRIPQYIREYDRGSDVEIWEIKYQMACHRTG